MPVAASIKGGRKGKGKRPPKTAANSAERPMQVQPHGGALSLVGNPGNRGGGRQPDAWRKACRDALEDAKGLDVVKAIISGDIHELIGKVDGKPIYAETRNKDRLGAIRFLAEYAEGKPPQKIEVSGDGAAAASGEVVMARVLGLVGRLLAAAPADSRLKALREIEQAEVVVSDG